MEIIQTSKVLFNHATQDASPVVSAPKTSSFQDVSSQTAFLNRFCNAKTGFCRPGAEIMGTAVFGPIPQSCTNVKDCRTRPGMKASETQTVKVGEPKCTTSGPKCAKRPGMK